MSVKFKIMVNVDSDTLFLSCNGDKSSQLLVILTHLMAVHNDSINLNH